MNSDISPDTGSGVNGVGADFGGDLAKNAGVDLNAGGLAKATMMSCDAPPPEYYHPETFHPVPAEIREIDCPQNAWDEKLQEQISQMNELHDLAGPANEPEDIGEPLQPEYGDHPPDGDEI